MSKYGLNLRPQQKKQPARRPLPTVLGFGNDDDDNVEKEISRQASKNKSLKDIEEQQRKALEEDPSAFDYDEVYDQMKAKTVKPKVQDRDERKPKYIENLLKKAEQRQKEQEIVYERKLAKERTQEDHLYADKDKFVTGAYKRKLAEQAKWLEEERLHELREEKDDVTKKKDLTDFYFNLGKNVAFGANDAEERKSAKHVEQRKRDKSEDRKAPMEEQDKQKPPKELNISKESSQKEVDQSQTSFGEGSSKPVDAKPVSDAIAEESVSVEQPPKEQPKNTNHHKRGEDAVSAAKERFLARKRAKESLDL